MNEKPDTIVVAIPFFLLLCCLGPLVLGLALAGIAGGLGFAAILGAALAVAAIVYGVLRWRMAALERAEIAPSCAPMRGACPTITAGASDERVSHSQGELQ